VTFAQDPLLSIHVAEMWSLIEERVDGMIDDQFIRRFGNYLRAQRLDSQMITGQIHTLEWLVEQGGFPLAISIAAPVARRFVFDFPVQITGITLVGDPNQIGDATAQVAYYPFETYPAGRVLLSGNVAANTGPHFTAGYSFRDYDVVNSWGVSTDIPPGDIVEVAVIDAQLLSLLTVAVRVQRMG
jgi:hypothetical protein